MKLERSDEFWDLLLSNLDSYSAKILGMMSIGDTKWDELITQERIEYIMLKIKGFKNVRLDINFLENSGDRVSACYVLNNWSWRTHYRSNSNFFLWWKIKRNELYSLIDRTLQASIPIKCHSSLKDACIATIINNKINVTNLPNELQVFYFGFIHCNCCSSRRK